MTLTQNLLLMQRDQVTIKPRKKMHAKEVNSLTAIDGHDRQYFNELRARVVSPQIFVRLQSLIAR